ncbi:MAG: 2'-5' RNA ligase family protein [Patescibacteria group bacterium]
MISKGYTLWLVPAGQVFKKFNALIQKLAKENNAPVFCPHITLLGEIMLPRDECIKKTIELVKDQRPFTVALETIGYQDYYFRTLFVYAKKSPQLVKLHERAKEIFNMKIPPFMPHLSLLYGLFPQEIKDKIIKEIGKDQSAEFEIGKVILIKGGEIKDWKIVAEFPLR